MSPGTQLTAAISSVINRCGDLGLNQLADQIMRAGPLWVQRRLLNEAQHAARAIRLSSTHFNQRPIAEYAATLEEATERARILVDKALDVMAAANQPHGEPPLTYEQRIDKDVAERVAARVRK